MNKRRQEIIKKISYLIIMEVIPEELPMYNLFIDDILQGKIINEEIFNNTGYANFEFASSKKKTLAFINIVFWVNHFVNDFFSSNNTHNTSILKFVNLLIDSLNRFKNKDLIKDELEINFDALKITLINQLKDEQL